MRNHGNLLYVSTTVKLGIFIAEETYNTSRSFRDGQYFYQKKSCFMACLDFWEHFALTTLFTTSIYAFTLKLW